LNKKKEKRIETLAFETKRKAYEFLLEADKWLQNNGWEDYTCEITEAKRDIYMQAGLYSLGRKYVHWQGWQEVDLKKVVTWTMESNHLSGHAFDIALYFDKMYHWPDPDEQSNLLMWLSLAEIGQGLGLYPGAFWEGARQDYPHFSTKPG
jgi:hypothetical protein